MISDSTREIRRHRRRKRPSEVMIFQGLLSSKRDYFFLLGLLLIFLIHMPVFILNRNMVAIIHDEFDGEVIAYMFRARSFFPQSIPQLFDGALASSLLPSALLFALPYVFFTPDWAFFIDYVVILFISYIGMYLCVRYVLNNRLISLGIGLLFTILPFYSVYGLCVMGQPLLLFCFLNLWYSDSKTQKEYIVFYVVIVLFGFSSSLVLVGYADIALLMVAAFYSIIRRKPNWQFILGIIFLVISYIICSLPLLIPMILQSSTGSVSHRKEWIVSADTSGFWNSAREMFFYGQYHAASCQTQIAKSTFLILVLGLLFFKKLSIDNQKKLFQMLNLYIFAMFISLFYSFWHCEPIVELRNKLGGMFVQFQIDRVYWLYPCIWFLLLAYGIYFLYVFFERNKVLGLTLSILLFSFNITYIWDNSSIKVNYNAWLEGKYIKSQYASINEFYQKELFDEIKSDIGKPLDSYKVVSVCLYPSIPLYNEFYCLDGYSNNYSLSYKHQFSQIISKELDRSKFLKKYFYEWGNRCYVFSSEYVGAYYVSKSVDRKIGSLDLNYDLLKEKGCEYIFSGVEISDESDHIQLLKIYSSTSSYYNVYLYKII